MFNKLAQEDKNYVKNNAEHFVSSINSYLGFMIHYSTYKIRRKMLLNDIAPEWKNVIMLDDKMAKIRLKKNYKENIMQQEKLRKQRRNRRRNHKKRQKNSQSNLRLFPGLNPFI